jgi:Fe-S cluster assembly protein SufD
VTTTTSRRRQREYLAPPFRWEAILERARANDEPEWVIKLRRDAWEVYESMPMPTLRDEAWRRTDYTHIDWNAAGRFVQPNGAGVKNIPAQHLAPLIGDEQGGLIAWVDDQPVHRELNPRITGQGVIFTDLHTACREHADLVRANLFTKALLPGEGKFAALHAAAWTHGLFVYVPRGVAVELPLHSIFYKQQIGATLGHVMIVLEDGAQATVLQEYLSPEADSHAAYIGGTSLLIGRGANLRYVSLQSWGHHLFEFSHGRGHVARDGQLDWVVGSMGSKLTKSFMQISLDGEGAWGRMSGMFFADGNQVLDHDTYQSHNAPHTTSDLLFKSALKDYAHSVWRGMIHVKPGAIKTDGFQANRNMLMSKTARADSIPGLEIEADDVRCTHAATVGKMEEEYIFYLMTRGVPRLEAERLFLDGYFWDVLERIPFEEVQNRLLADVDRKLLGLHNIQSS